MVDQNKKKIRILRYAPHTSSYMAGFIADTRIDVSGRVPRIHGAPVMMDYERVFCREPASHDLSYLVVEDRELKT